MAAAPSQAIDRVDQEIIAALRRDARTSNKEMSKSLGVAESTIAARIRSMSDRRVMRIVLLRDIRALGYDLLAHLDIYIEGRPAQAVAQDLAVFDQVAAVNLFDNAPQIIVQVNAKSRYDLADFMSQKLSTVAGIRSIESSISLEIIKYVSEFAAFAG